MPRALAIAVVLASGCAGGALLQPKPYDPVIRWSRADTTRPVFLRDRYECLQESQQQVGRAFANRSFGASRSDQVTDSGLFVACMEARGYERDSAGPFAPPAGGEIATY